MPLVEPRDSPIGRGLGLRYACDLRSLLSIGLCLIALVVPFVLFPHPSWAEAGFLALAFAVNCGFCFVANIIAHNHCHTPTFVRNAQNKVFEFALNLCRGYTTAAVVMTHNWNHHRFAGRDGDWARTSLAPAEFGPGRRLLTYLARAMLEIRRQGRVYRRVKATPTFRRRFVFEQSLLLAVTLVGLYVNPVVMIALVILPWAIAAFSLLSVNYLQHEACEPETEWKHSRNFLGRIENWFLFNNGYHTAHHLFPNMHWSELKQAHEKIPAGSIPPEFNTPSLARHLGDYLAKR